VRSLTLKNTGDRRRTQADWIEPKLVDKID
jgi:hypothetical protein